MGYLTKEWAGLSAESYLQIAKRLPHEMVDARDYLHDVILSYASSEVVREYSSPSHLRNAILQKVRWRAIDGSRREKYIFEDILDDDAVFVNPADEDDMLDSLIYRLGTEDALGKYKDSDPATIYDQQEEEALLRERVEHALSLLSEEECIAFQMLADGYSVSEVARTLSRTEESVKKALQRARKRARSLSRIRTD